jgi:hypothetical protein
MPTLIFFIKWFRLRTHTYMCTFNYITVNLNTNFRTMLASFSTNDIFFLFLEQVYICLRNLQGVVYLYDQKKDGAARYRIITGIPALT